jgi:small subunit ribosomal protein S17
MPDDSAAVNAEQQQPQTNTTTSSENARALRKSRVGVVISNKMDKTAVVETITRVPHPKFRKIVKHAKKFYVHDEENKSQIGDLVRIMETRPLSKLKRWRLVEVLKH